MKAYELLAKPEAWTKGAYARSNNGMETIIGSGFGVCWCAVGAIKKCYQHESWQMTDALLRLHHNLNSVYGEKTRLIIEWNDAPERTHAEVVAKLKELDI